MTDFTFINHLLEKLMLLGRSRDMDIFLGYGKNNAHTFVNELYNLRGRVFFLLS